MKLAILLLLVLIGLVFGFLLYRVLIRSKCFAKLIGGAVELLPETPDEVINRLDDAESRACNCADRCDANAHRYADANIKIRKQLRKPGKPGKTGR